MRILQENGGGILGIIMLLTMFLGGCKNKNEQTTCFKQKQIEYRDMSLHPYLRKSLRDTLESWIERDLKLQGQDDGISYGFNTSDWKIDDIVLFNKDTSRAILLILSIDKDEHAKSDDVHMIAAEKRKEGWWFYYVAMPSIGFDRGENNNRPYTSEQLSEKIIEEYIKGGYFKKGTCKIDYWYIDGWFDREGRDLYKWHQEFLKNDNIFRTSKDKDGYVAPRKDVQENGGGLFGIIMLIMVFLGGCKNKEEQLKCFEEQIAKYNEDEEYKNLKIAVVDSIKKWTAQELKNTVTYIDSNYTWKVDEFIYNENKTRIFGWTLTINKDSLYTPTDEADKDFLYPLDYVDYFVGEKRNGQWYFYIHNMPGIWFARTDNNSQPYTFEYLSKVAKQKVVEGGVFKKCTCEMNYSYINEWIDREDRDLYKWHQEFLKSNNK